MEGDMIKRNLILLVIFTTLATTFFYGCEKYAESTDINGLFRKNDLSLKMKIRDDAGGYTIEKIPDGNDSCLKIDVHDEFSLRGEAPTVPGNTYKISVTMKNIDADPVILYSFWKKPVTSLRNYTLQGENGNPPSSDTQEFYDTWTTFEETFETQEGEDSFLLTLLSHKGIFYIKEINIELIE